MNYLITGATGFVGKPLVAKLMSDGHKVTILTRNPEKAKGKLPPNVAIFAWNPEVEPAPTSAFTGVEAVIHLAGEGIAEKRWSQKQKEKISSSRVLGTRNLVQTINGLANPPKVFVSSSAIGFYGDRLDDALSETSAGGVGFLPEVCKEWEAEAQKVSSAVRRVLLRTGIVLENGGGALKPLIPLFSLGAGGPVADGRQWMSWIHRDDLVRLLIFASQNENLTGPVNGTAPNPVRNSEFSKALGKALHRPAFMPAPAFALKIVMGELACLVLFSQNVLPKKALDWGFHFKFQNIQEALNDICKKKMNTLRCEQLIRLPIEKVFPFFADEKNLEALTPPWLHFKVLSKSTAGMQSGTLINYRLRVHGIFLRWQSVIEEWVPNQGFVDRQIKGPYRHWHHTHTFTPHAEGTLMVDIVQYRVPGGVLGQLLGGWYVKRDLARIFEFRRKKVEQLFQKESSVAIG